MKRTLLACASILVFAVAVNAQDQAALSPTSSVPSIDGAIGANEYQYSSTVSGMSLGASLGDDGQIYLAIQVKTAGWVALGVGGTKMNGSRLFLAYDTGSKKVFSEQLGAGHFHGDVKDPAVGTWAVKQAGGVTTLELVLPASKALTNGKLNLLFAYSDGTSFMARHKARGSVTIPVQE